MLFALRISWWAWMELNHRPHAYQACALTELSYRPKDNKEQSASPLFCTMLPSLFEPIIIYIKDQLIDLSKLNSDNRNRVNSSFLRKEVIQPLVPQRLPCYDFTPIISHTLGACLPYGLAQQLLVQPTLMV